MKKLIDYPIEHIGFVVPDLEKTQEHIGNMFNIEEFQIYDFSPTKAWSYGKEIEGYRLKIAMAKVPEGRTGFEIIQPISSEGLHHDMAYSGKKGMNHIAFKVDDYDYWRVFFQEKGTTIIFESETEDEVNGYRRCFYVKDNVEDIIYEIKEKAYFRNK